MEPQLAALCYLLLALAAADRGFKAPNSDLAVAAPGDDAAAEREGRKECRVIEKRTRTSL